MAMIKVNIDMAMRATIVVNPRLIVPPREVGKITPQTNITEIRKSDNEFLVIYIISSKLVVDIHYISNTGSEELLIF